VTTHARPGRDRADPDAERREVTPQAPSPESDSLAPVPVPGLVGGALLRTRADDDILGGTEVSASTRAVLARRRGRGSPLPSEFATRMETGFGVPLDGVRVHTDPESGRLAQQLQSTAFTLGSDIYFSRCTYAPSTASGQRLLAHELAHVAQQSTSTGAGGGPVTVGRAGDQAEAQADAMADTVLRSRGAGAGDGAALRRRMIRRSKAVLIGAAQG